MEDLPFRKFMDQLLYSFKHLQGVNLSVDQVQELTETLMYAYDHVILPSAYYIGATDKEALKEFKKFILHRKDLLK